jgi:peptidoglycan/LPS O-acetylase OafA/YrhL
MKDIKNFYIKKFIRIYPLYWVALISLIIIFGVFQLNPGHVDPYNFSLDNVLLHFSGLQGIFPYTSIQSMWFVGVIVLFYLLYPVIIFLSKNLLETVIISLSVFVVLGILHFFLGLIAIEALVYFPVFITGIFIRQFVYSSKKINDEDFFKKVLYVNLILIFLIFLVFILTEFYQVNFQLFKPQLLLLGAMIPSCIIYLIFTHLFIKIKGKIMVLISLIAFATYAIYLFHHQFLAIFAFIIDVFIQNIILQDLIIMTFGFAGAILFGIIIQKIEQLLFTKYNPAFQR